MSLRDEIVEWSKGDRLRCFWRLYRWRENCRMKVLRNILTFLLNCSARRHGGYVGSGAAFADVPSLPHGFHGVYISRYARIGAGCRIYPAWPKRAVCQADTVVTAEARRSRRLRF